MNPADLYASMEACVRADRHEDAFFLFALGGTFGSFDTRRVADRSAHGAVPIIRQRHIDVLTPAQWAPVAARLEQTLGDPDDLARFCARIRPAGPPTYYPAYMIQHGMGAFLGQGSDGLIPGFEPAAAWESSVQTFLNCLPAT